MVSKKKKNENCVHLKPPRKHTNRLACKLAEVKCVQPIVIVNYVTALSTLISFYLFITCLPVPIYLSIYLHLSVLRLPHPIIVLVNAVEKF